MLRDLAAKLGKKVELVTQGEATELDKAWSRRSPTRLTHPGAQPAATTASNAGRPHRQKQAETGTITLAASHQAAASSSRCVTMAVA